MESPHYQTEGAAKVANKSLARGGTRIAVSGGGRSGGREKGGDKALFPNCKSLTRVEHAEWGGGAKGCVQKMKGD